MQQKQFRFNGENFPVKIIEQTNGQVSAVVKDATLDLQFEKIDANTFSIIRNGRRQTAHFASDKDSVYIAIDGNTYMFERGETNRPGFAAGDSADGATANEISAPMPGKILKMLVKTGDEVRQNQTLFIVEAMKMENDVKSPRDGKVSAVLHQENDLVSVGDAIVALQPVEAK